MGNKKMWTVLAIGSAAALAAVGTGGDALAQSQGQSQGQSSQGQGQGAEQGESARGGGAQGECRPSDAAQVAEVLRQLHGINQTEIKNGKLAEKRAQAPEIKSFASLMVQNHTDADKTLTDIAKRENIDLGAKPSDPIVQAIERADSARDQQLRGMHGASFDVAYIAPEAAEHTLAVEITDVGLQHAQGDVKQFLDSMHGMLSTHLDAAQKLEQHLAFQPTAVGGGPGGQQGAKPQGQQGGEQQGGEKGGEQQQQGSHPQGGQQHHGGQQH
jgi:putative membrane protein